MYCHTFCHMTWRRKQDTYTDRLTIPLCVCIFLDPVVGIVTAVLIIALGALTIFMFFLHYTGFLCKVATLPRAMIVSICLSVSDVSTCLESTYC